MSGTDTLGIYIPDPTYTRVYEDVEDWEEESAKFKINLEAEYGIKFEKTDIGPGADLPAYVTWVSLAAWPYVAAALVLFFSGKKISDNLDAWSEIYQKRIKPFFKHRPIFDRNG